MYRCKYCDFECDIPQLMAGHVTAKHCNLKQKYSVIKIKKEEEYNKNPKLCLFCKKPFPYKNHNKHTFCNTSCSAKYNNPLRTKIRNCPNCGKVLPNCIKNYCNNNCFNEYKRKKGYSLWLEDNYFPTSGALRSYLNIYFENKCCLCGITNWNGKKIVLEIHHIDGNGSNNIKSNLLLLCPNCHSQTDSFKGKNRGNGRYKRLEKLREQKFLLEKC